MKGRCLLFGISAFVLLLPFLTAQDGPARRPGGENPIDSILRRQWRKLKLRPNSPASDFEFLRRVRLDLTGTLPQPEEIRTFVSLADSRKRERKIDELLRTPEFAGYWAERLTNLFLEYGQRRFPTIEPLKRYLREALQRGVPYDQIVRALLTAEGSNKKADETAFLLEYLSRDRQKKVLTIQVSKLFLGTQLQCAQCHDHPFDKWTKKDFEAMVAFFAPTNLRFIQRTKPIQKSEVEIVDRPARRRFRRGRRMPEPRFIDGTRVREGIPRRVLADLITSPNNLQFARATVNRFWAEFFGRAFVEPVDDFSSKNLPKIPELLDTLAQGFIRNRYDLRWLFRTITNSRAYQLSSKVHPKRYPDLDRAKENFAVQIVRPMSPEQTARAYLGAQGMYPKDVHGRRAGRLLFGFVRRLRRLSGTESAARPSDWNATVQMIMAMMNTDSPIYAGLKPRRSSRLSKILKRTRDPGAVITEIFLSTVSRPPDPAELRSCLAYYREHGRNDQAFQDIFFVLLNTNEFFFNH